MIVQKNSKNLFRVKIMQYLFEYSDAFTTPYEAFLQDVRANNFPIKPHWHYFVEIIYILEGSTMVDCDNTSYILEAGDLILFPPKTVHSIYSTKWAALRYAVIKFDASSLTISNSYTPKIQSILESVRQSPLANLYFCAADIQDFPVKELLQDCIRELKDKQYGYDIQVHSHLCTLLVHLLRLWQKNGFQPWNILPAATLGTGIDTITEYIDSHSSEPLRVEELAEMCHMSYSYFAKNFKQLYGKSCKEYIEFIKICKADDMLLFTDLSLSYISQETGFTDCSHFIKTYKKIKGITPGQRRMAHSPGAI